MLKKRDISNKKFTVLKAQGKHSLANVICYCIMMSFMALDGVTSFLGLKGVTNTYKRMRHSPAIAEIVQCSGGKLEEAEDLKCVFFVYCVLESK